MRGCTRTICSALERPSDKNLVKTSSNTSIIHGWPTAIIVWLSYYHIDLCCSSQFSLVEHILNKETNVFWCSVGIIMLLALLSYCSGSRRLQRLALHALGGAFRESTAIDAAPAAAYVCSR